MHNRFFATFIVFFLLLNTKKVSAQEEFIEPPSRYLTTIPFIQLTGGIVLMQARVGNLPDTLNFILDTGSSGISLDSTTVEFLKLKRIPTNKTIRGIAGIRTVSFVFDQQLHITGLTMDSLDFHINNYEILTSVYGVPIDGIIGYSVLSRYIIKIDYDSSKVHFWSHGTLRYPKGGFLLKPLMGTLPVYPLRVRDAKTINTRFLYDMGAGLCLMLSKDLIADSNFLGKRRKMWPKKQKDLAEK